MHRLVHHQLHGNAADSHFVDHSSLLSEPDSENKSWLNGTGFFEYYHYLQLADTLKYILNGMFICIIKEQCSNRGECTWTAQNGCHRTIIDILCQSEWFHIADTPVAKLPSTERQQWLAFHQGYSAWRLVTDSHKWHTGCVYRQMRNRYAACPILNLSINSVSTIFHLICQVIDRRLGHFDAYWNYWQPL